MDKLTQRRQIVEDLLNKYAQVKPAYGEIGRQTIFDREQDRYQLVNTGWENRRRVYGCLIHVDIQADGKIWIQHDGTEYAIADQLVEKGVPKQDIVLAFRPAYIRQYTDFAVG